MVAQERKIAQNDRLFIVRVHNLVNELFLAFVLFNSLLELGLEWVEHPFQEISSAYVVNLVLNFYKSIVNVDFLDSATMHRHLEYIHFNDFLIPFLVKFFRWVHINSNDERTSKLCLKTVNLLAGVSHL